MKLNINNLELFNLSNAEFETTALKIFQFQYEQIEIYKQYVDLLNIDVSKVNFLHQIPFLPIQFFKTHKIIHSDLSFDSVFESSGTTSADCSKHYIHKIEIYEKSILASFKRSYGNPEEYIILALLPHYLERENSSLVYMVNYLMEQSKQEKKGFYLNNTNELTNEILKLKKSNKKLILFGVTFALLDYFETLNIDMGDLIIIETGGMKGKRKEITKESFHQILSKKIGASQIHSEYGMTELLSPSFSLSKGIFHPPSTLKAMVRDVSDPYSIAKAGRGALNIIDLANVYSCSFIATDDIGEVNNNGDFEVLGRLSNTDIRGCNLLYH